MCFQRSEDWLLTALDFKLNKIRGNPRISAENQQAEYLMECLYYGEKYNLKSLLSTVFQKLVDYNFRSYKNNFHSKSLSENGRPELLEVRFRKIDQYLIL